ncbi:hypothetical protein CANMA_004734 [Candida margitis]|uniref:uncharacterized protein n=1 Tax=Candida margitis TaxID=1775924 RepID=UPI002226EB0F|nr:uncharacterized protein CANMA_004734 [Candida margitis]KAI5953895.1 hypothetical protein CANMA_004734 [Candida margitis]
MAPKRKAITSPTSTPSKMPKVNTHTPTENKQFYQSTINLVVDLREGEEQLAAAFIKLPSKKLYPDYFHLIKSPISINEIQKRINTRYTGESTEEFLDDFYLLLENATTYNDADSWIVANAKKIVDFVTDQVTEYESTVPASETTTTDIKQPKIKLKLKGSSAGATTGVVSPSPKAGDTEITFGKLPELCSNVVKDVMHRDFEDIGVISGPFLDEVDQDVYTDYSNFVSKPMAFNTVLSMLEAKKLFSPKYSLLDNLQKFHDIVTLIFTNARAYNNEDSQIYQDAVLLEEYFEESYGALRNKIEAVDTAKPKPAKLKISLNKNAEKKNRKTSKFFENEGGESAADASNNLSGIDDEATTKVKVEDDRSAPSAKPSVEIHLDKTTDNTMGKTLPTLLESNSIIQESSIFSSPAIVSHITKYTQDKIDASLSTSASRESEIKQSLFPAQSQQSIATLFSYKVPANGYVDQSYTISLPNDVSPYVSLKTSLHHLLYLSKRSDLIDGHGYLNSTSEDDFQCSLTVNGEVLNQPNDCFEELKGKENLLAVQYDIKLAHGLNMLTFECKVAPSLSRKVKNTIIQDQPDELSGSRHTRHQLQQMKMSWDVESITFFVVCNSAN